MYVYVYLFSGCLKNGCDVLKYVRFDRTAFSRIGLLYIRTSDALHPGVEIVCDGRPGRHPPQIDDFRPAPKSIKLETCR